MDLFDNSNIALIVLIGFIIVALFIAAMRRRKYKKNNSNIKNKINNSFSTPKLIDRTNKRPRTTKDSVIDDVISWDESGSAAIIAKDKLNPNLIYNQFHNDYRDTITALNNLVPERKQKFNLANIPLVYSEPEADEVKNLLNDFIKILNENLKAEVPSYRNPNSGWDEAIPDPNIKSGWDKVQDKLGLPTSLWEPPAENNLVKLVGILKVQKYETDDEIKYTISMVLQKLNVDDQMILKGSFVQDKRPLNDENNFFVTTSMDLRIIIEDLFIEGYLSKEGPDAQLMFDNDKEKFYNYDTLEYNNLLDPKFVQKVLMEKYKIRTTEMEQRNAMLDEEGRAFHRTLPSVYDFSNIRGTRTIFDDFNTRKEFV